MVKMKSKILITLSVFLFVTHINAQNIRGNVTDIETKLPLVGVNVTIKNTNNHTLTDSLGNFALNGEGILEISSIGYEKYSIVSI